MQENMGYRGDMIKMDNTSIGKEWKHYKNELDNARRRAKKEAERKEEMTKGRLTYLGGDRADRESYGYRIGGGGGSGGRGGRGGYGGGRDSYGGGGGGYGRPPRRDEAGQAPSHHRSSYSDRR